MNLFYDLPHELQNKIYNELHKLNFNKSLNNINNFKSLWEEIDGSDGSSNLDTNPIEFSKYNYINNEEWLISKEKWNDIDKSNEKYTICFPKVLLRILETEGYNYICDLIKCIKCNEDCINSYILHHYRDDCLSEKGYICDNCSWEDSEEEDSEEEVDSEWERSETGLYCGID